MLSTSIHTPVLRLVILDKINEIPLKPPGTMLLGARNTAKATAVIRDPIIKKTVSRKRSIKGLILRRSFVLYSAIR